MRLIGLCLLALLALPALASAQDVESRYQALVEDAVMEFGEQRYAEARALFAQAHQLRPNARTLRGLGMTAFELRNYTEALRMLRASQLSRINPLTAQQQEHVAGLIDRAEAFVGTYTIKAPEGTVFEVDGNRKPLEEDGTLMLDNGKRSLVAIMPGGTRDKRTVDVRGRERGLIEFHEGEVAADGAAPAEAAPSEGTDVAAAADDMPETSEAGPSLLPWILIGSGGALVLTGMFTGYAAYSNGKTVTELCPAGVPCADEVGEVKDSAESLALVTDVLWLVGAGVAGAGVYFLLTGDGGESAALQPSFGISDDGGGVTLRGKF